MYQQDWQMGIDWASVQFWGLRILAAIAILILTHFVAKGIKWGIARLIDRISFLRQSPAGTSETVGTQVGVLAYWIVWLVGLIVALQPLGLSQVLSPVRELTDVTFAFLPRILGAGIFLAFGLIVAKVVRKIVEALLTTLRVDHWATQSGFVHVDGESATLPDKGISGTLGLIAYVLVAVPAAIGALQILGVSAISDPATMMLDLFLTAIPHIVAAALWLAIAYILAQFAKQVVERLLTSLGFNRTVGSVIPTTGAATPAQIVGIIVFTAIMLFAAIEAARQLGGSAIAALLIQITDLGGRVIFGAVIIAVGAVLAKLISGFVSSSTGESGGWAESIVRYAIIALAVAMGLRFMGLANEIVNLAFGLILGSAAVAAALAFGLGGRPTAHRLLEKWTRENEVPPAPKNPTPPAA